MSFIIEQKIKGNIYLYRVESQWDKVKKKHFQKRTYIGPKYPKNGKKKFPNETNLLNKSYGNVFFLEQIAKQLGIYSILETCFPSCFKEILALTYYQITQGSPFYLFPYWLDEHHLPAVKKLDSSSITTLLEFIGKQEKKRFKCLEQWMQSLNPLNALFYDISSISSYSQHIPLIEWGYNRDNDALAQLNIGMVFCEEKRLPIYYHLYPGSIVDVSTLKNCKAYLTTFGIKDFLFILDRGFFSTANILAMNQADDDKVDFIIGLPFKLKKAKELIRLYKKALRKTANSFLYKKQIINHIESKVSFKDHDFNAHVFYNEKIELDVRHQLLVTLFELEKTIPVASFSCLKEWISYRDDNLSVKYRNFFKWNRKTKVVEKNFVKIKAYTNTNAYFILLTNKNQVSPEQLLTHYNNKDLVEKVFDVLKNELDAKRLRTHNGFTTQGKIFTMFISLVIHSEIVRVMNQNDLFKTRTVKELLLELKKIKINYLHPSGKPIVSEISKKNKNILKIFNMSL